MYIGHRGVVEILLPLSSKFTEGINLKKFLILSLLCVCGIVYAEWSPHNKAGEKSNLYMGDCTVNKRMVYTISSSLAISSSTSIDVSETSFIKVGNVTGVVDVTSGTPSLTGGTTGQIVVLVGTTDSYPTILADEGTLTNSKLQLGAAWRTIGLYDVLKLIFNGQYWVEISFENN